MKGSIPGLFGDDDAFDKENLISFGKQMRNIYHLWLISEIDEPKMFVKWFDILSSATENDLVVIHINCDGGSVFTAVQLITQIKTCEAQVVCQIESSCCSAATMIALACDGLLCYPHGYMMIHTSSGFTFGKQSDIRKHEDFYNKWLEDFFNEIYKDFLTEKEIKDVLNGHDMWISSEDVMKRFKHRVGIINKENAKAAKQEKEHMKKLNSFMSSLQNSESSVIDTTLENSDGGDGGSRNRTKKPTKKSKKTKKPAKKSVASVSDEMKTETI